VHQSASRGTARKASRSTVARSSSDCASRSLASARKRSACSARRCSVTSRRVTTAATMRPSSSWSGEELAETVPGEPSAKRTSISCSRTVSPCRSVRTAGQSSGS
jgi:hypothetical protein